MAIENVIIVINKTRLEQLVYRFNTTAQAQFYIEHSGGDFNDYQIEHDTFMRVLDDIKVKLSGVIKYKVIDREYLPNFMFSENDLIIVLGQDGLVANTAKYVKNRPIIAINPDENRYDGILLPFTSANFLKYVERTVNQKSVINPVTMAEAKLNDGQRLLAFNDFFIGPASHTSARYKLTFGRREENQSSSGIIVSTGAGSTGWLSSLFNMANSISGYFRKDGNRLANLKMQWHENKLVFVVREPFRSKYSEISMTTGVITPRNNLQIESFMPSNGVIFSDGIEKDFLSFNSGSIAEIGIAEQKAMIVIDDAKIISKKRKGKSKK